MDKYEISVDEMKEFMKRVVDLQIVKYRSIEYLLYIIKHPFIETGSKMIKTLLGNSTYIKSPKNHCI